MSYTFTFVSDHIEASANGKVHIDLNAVKKSLDGPDMAKYVKEEEYLAGCFICNGCKKASKEFSHYL